MTHKTSIITLNNYRLDGRNRFERIAPAALVERAREYEGRLVLWDPESDEDGYLLVGDSEDEITAEFIAHFGDDIEYPPSA